MKTDDSKHNWVQSLGGRKEEKSWGMVFAISFFAGWFGIDRLYLGFTTLGVLKLVTLGGFGLWWLIDLILLLANQMRDVDGDLIKRPF